TRVQQSLDDLENEDVPEAVETVRPGARGRPDARLDEARAGPVVELAVGDPGGPARGRAAVARRGVEVGQLVTEQEPLRSLRHRRLRRLLRTTRSAAHGLSPRPFPTPADCVRQREVHWSR